MVSVKRFRFCQKQRRTGSPSSAENLEEINHAGVESCSQSQVRDHPDSTDSNTFFQKRMNLITRSLATYIKVL